MYLCRLAGDTRIVVNHAKRKQLDHNKNEIIGGRFSSLFRSSHPTQPMTEGSIQEFEIDKNKKTNCHLELDTYRVMKIREQFRNVIETNFYAITDEEFVRARPDLDILTTKVKRQRYFSQIGFATCKPGLIHRVEVNDAPLNARRCGIATVLTELCLIDPEFYPINDKNWAIKNLRQDARIKNHVETHCSKLIALEMSAKPLDGAFAYFSAALRLGYDKLIIHEYDLVEEECIDDGFQFWDVVEAKNNYDTNTGHINTEPRNINVLDSILYFCDEIK